MAVRNVDVIVATSPQFFCGWAGVLCRWLRRRPFLLEVRDIWPESIVTVGAMQRSPAVRLLEWTERRMYAAAQRIVTVGNGYRTQLLRRGVPHEKIAVVPNGVDARQFVPHPSSTALRSEWNADGKFVCAYLGTVGMAHGLDVVLRAAEKLKHGGRDGTVFWIVGDGAERERLEREAQARGLDNVRFAGLVPKNRMAEVIASCDACLVHLRRTALFETVIPSKIFEIMAMNVPIIMGVRGQAERIVLAARAGVAMIPEDENSLLSGIEAIAGKPWAYRHGRRYVAEYFDRDVLAKRMLGELLAVAGRPDEMSPATVPFPEVRPAPATDQRKAA